MPQTSTSVSGYTEYRFSSTLNILAIHFSYTYLAQKLFDITYFDPPNKFIQRQVSFQ